MRLACLLIYWKCFRKARYSAVALSIFIEGSEIVHKDEKRKGISGLWSRACGDANTTTKVGNACRETCV